MMKHFRGRYELLLLGSALVVGLAGCSSQEDTQTQEGHLVEVISAAPEAGSIYYLKRDGVWTKLIFDEKPALSPNQDVIVHGKPSSDGSSFDVDTIEPVDAEDAVRNKAQKLSNQAPEGKVALFLVRDEGITGEPVSASEIADELHTHPESANVYFQEASFGQYAIDVDVLGWYTLDLTNCDRGSTATQIEAMAASQDGYDSNQYRHAAFLMMRDGDLCFGGGGWGTFGSPQGTGYSWYGSNWAPIYVHEIGHNLGMHHASGQVCKDHSGGFLTDSGQCNLIEYHDPLDVMGAHWEFRHFSSHFKNLLGWLAPENVHHVTSSGQYIIQPQDEASTGIQSLMIPIPGSTEFYHVETRNGTGFNAGLEGGVFVRKVRESLVTQTYLLDMSPQSHQDGGENQKYSSLSVGQTYHDQKTGISIGLEGFTGEAAQIQVGLGGATCNDGQANGEETDVDCGGPCAPCADGLSCEEHWDCIDYSCESGVCVDADDGGLQAEYFYDVDFVNRAMSSIVPTVDFDSHWSAPPGYWQADNFGIRYSGKIIPRFSEAYTFFTNTDDAVRLWINGQLLIDEDYGAFSANITLTANQEYDIVMEYIEYGGEARAQLRWSSQSQSEEVVPKSRLRPGLCSVATAIDLGKQGTQNIVPSDACVKISQYPSWYQWGGGTPQLQTGTGGQYPVVANFEDACTGATGSVTFTSSWQQRPVGLHFPGCPTLIQLGGNGSPLELRWQ